MEDATDLLSPPEAPPAPADLQTSHPQAAPASSRGKIVPPDEFVVAFLTNDPASALEYNGYPNPAVSMADACLRAYLGYLLLISAKFQAAYKSNPALGSLAVKGGFPDPNAIWALYDAAV